VSYRCSPHKGAATSALANLLGPMPCYSYISIGIAPVNFDRRNIQAGWDPRSKFVLPPPLVSYRSSPMSRISDLSAPPACPGPMATTAMMVRPSPTELATAVEH
jgi:hypothetical protein